MEEERHKKRTKTSELSSAVWDIINSSSYLYTLDFAFAFPLVITESSSKQTSTIHPNYDFLSWTVHTEDIKANFVFCTTDYFVGITSFKDDGYLKFFVCFYQFLLNWVQEFLLVCTYILRMAFRASCKCECVF